MITAIDVMIHVLCKLSPVMPWAAPEASATARTGGDLECSIPSCGHEAEFGFWHAKQLQQHNTLVNAFIRIKRAQNKPSEGRSKSLKQI